MGTISKQQTSAFMRRGRIFGCGISALVLMLSAAQAADSSDASDADTLETVVVSAPHYVPTGTDMATKLGATLLETPQSLSVITRDQVDLLDVQNLGQAVRYTSGVVGENYGVDQRYDYLTMRGFTPIQYVDGLQAPVGSISSIGVDIYGFQSVQALKGPASALYGMASPGGIVNQTSRRPEAETSGQALVQYGNYSDKEVAGDVTGTMLSDSKGEGVLLGRLTSLYRNSNTQTDGVHTQRFYIAPAMTWLVSEDTSLTFLNYYQYDSVKGDANGFLPIYGTLYKNPNGKISSSTNLGDTKYNNYRRSQYGIGYDLKHQFNDWLSVEQNMKYFSHKYIMLDVYGTGLEDSDGDGTPDDYRTVTRANFPFKENIESLEFDNRASAHFDTGALQHTLLAGFSLRHYMDHADYGYSSATDIDLYEPQYGEKITTPDWISYTREHQNQYGLYAEDMIRYQNWILTIGGRHDWVDTTDYSEKKQDNKFTYRAGLSYQTPYGLAPYVSYATSFQPTAGTDYDGVSFKPSTGHQVEAGLKFEPKFLPEGVQGLSTLALYQINQENVKTDDPDHDYFYVQTGAVRVRGVEWEGVTRIYDRLTINASYTYTDSKVTKSNGDDLGKQMTMMPKQKISIYGDYTLQQGLFAGLGAGFGLRYTSSTYGDEANLYRNAPMALFDAMLHYDIHNWRAQLNASNLFNREYVARCTSESACFFGARRKILFTITRKF